MQGVIVIAVYLLDSIPHSVRNSFPIHIFYTTMNGMFANFSLPSSDHKQCNYSHFSVVSIRLQQRYINYIASVRWKQAQARSGSSESTARQTFAQLVLTKQAIFVGHPLLLQNKEEWVTEFWYGASLFKILEFLRLFAIL